MLSVSFLTKIIVLRLIPALVADWSDEYMDMFLKEFSMDADVPAAPTGGLAPAITKEHKSALAKAVEDQAGDLELFNLLGGLSADDGCLQPVSLPN